MNYRPSLNQVLLAMTLTALVLPLSGIWILRVYESALIRQTESELIAQGVVFSASYHQIWQDIGPIKPEQLGPRVADEYLVLSRSDSPWTPRPAILDLALSEVLPVPDPAVVVPQQADNRSVKAGSILQPIIKEAQKVILASVRIVDFHGLIVAASGESLGYSLANQIEIKRALRGEIVSTLRYRGPEGPQSKVAVDRSQSLRVFVAVPIRHQNQIQGVVLVSRTPRTIMDTILGKKWELTGLTAILALSVFALALIGQRLLGHPLKRAIFYAQSIASGGKPDQILPPPTAQILELNQLNAALTTMAINLDRRAQYLQGFANQVSHAFKTPLTTLKGSVEILIDHQQEMSVAERVKFLKNLDHEINRLERLVHKLLELARVDYLSRQGSEPLDVIPIFTRLIHHYHQLGLRIDQQLPEKLFIPTSEAMFETILTNLFDNVLVHAGVGAKVEVSSRFVGSEVEIVIADDGPGMSAVNMTKATTAFFTTKPELGGTGLGLNIVQNLVQSLGGQLTLSTNQPGLKVGIRLRVNNQPI